MSKVSVVKCTEYSNGLLKQKILESLHLIGFDPAQFKGKRVVLKPNLLMPSKLEKPIMTHPEFFRAVAQIVAENGGKTVMVESPAIHSLARTIKTTEYAEVVQREGIEVADPAETRTLRFEDGRKLKIFEIASAAFEADIIINLPKFKTHGLTYITGAVKNFFGLIPGLQKSKMHIKLPGPLDFSEYLLDLYGAILKGFDQPKIVLNIMDAIVAMEGEGPGTGGKPFPLHLILAGHDAVAVDTAAVKAAGLEVDKALTIQEGFRRDFCIRAEGEMQVTGAKIAQVQAIGFKPSKGTILSNMVRWPVTSKTFRNLFIDRPVPTEGKCTLCYQCKKICPSDAISPSQNETKVPSYNYKLCIRCYCCMEICPEAAIEKKNGRFQWMLRL